MRVLPKPGTAYQQPAAGSRLWNRYFVLIILISSCVNFSNYFLGSSFSLWIVDMGGSNATYGTIHSVYSILTLLARPVTGWIVDHGNRRSAFLLSTAVFASAMILMLKSPFFGFFVGMRLIQGVGNGCAITICNNTAYDFIPPDKMDKGIGYITLFSSLISATTATASIAAYNGPGPSFLVLWSLVALAVGALCSFFVVFRTPVEVKKFRFREVFKLSELLDRRSVKPALLSALSVYLAFGLRSFIILYGRSLGIANPGWFNTISACGLIVVRMVLDRIPRVKKTPARRIYFSYCIFVIYLLILTVCNNEILFFGAALLWSVVFGTLTPQLQSFAIQAAPVERRGAASSTFFCASDVGIILGSFFGGIIADWAGYPTMFALAIIPVVFCVVFFTFCMKEFQTIS